ncbi:hypothetical protein AJ80_00674 [Polytolypa hystricis UAMH7299]|uniref:BRCT domain-containing protein n=1 Tax=Polytolypa hystricis (strain UAMH7299) TaxID=1447883 RepID=A0A2B7Z2M9_POLH7|nr:hypothetical protein AJ80_00674 [Polytolypa hystricis UAMH7299]
MAEEVLPNKELPLAGVILCCTSILPEYRAELAKIATQMGAVHKFDLTSDVTHLIVGEVNTPKYKYVAKERSDVKVLKAEWIEAVRSSWMLGGDTNLQELEEAYRFPSLSGLSICLTGFADMAFRTHVQQTVTAHGAEFRRDLTKSATHLIARTAEGEKYKFAKLWNISVVSVKWLEDCLERGMVLEEILYDPSLPPEQQGIGAWNRSAAVAPVKRQEQSVPNAQRTRKLRRVASTKLGDHQEDIWTDIVGGDSLASFRQSDSEQRHEVQSGFRPRLIVQETKSFASETTLADRHGAPSQEMPPPAARGVTAEIPRGLWFGCRFLINGFSQNQTRILRDHILSRDAYIVSSVEELLESEPATSSSKYVLIPYNLPRSSIPLIDDTDLELDFVTDMWIEKCLHSSAFVPPEAHVTSTPFPRFPIPGFAGLRICSTGFSGIELLHVSKLVDLMGATYDEYLTSKASVLLCNTNSPNSEKLRHVHEWGIPAVIADWLWISVQTGEQKSFEPYLIKSKFPSQHKTPVNSEPKAVAPAQEQARQKEHVGEASGATSSTKQSEKESTTRESEGKNKPAPPIPKPTTHLGIALQVVSTNAPQSTSRSTSPSKHTHRTARSVSPTKIAHPSDANQAKPSDSPPCLNMAISEFLNSKRIASKSSNGDEKEAPKAKRRRQLFGRANSNSSTLTVTAPALPGNQKQRGFSRASSIDTMNEDGFGSVVEGLDSPSRKTTTSNAASFASILNNRPDKIEAQQLLESRLDLFRNGGGDFPGAGIDDGGLGFEDEESPAMTQLGYEEPDAAAMREKFTSKDKEDRAKRKNLVLGKVKEHEVLDGWGGGRRTRRAGRNNP